MKFLGLRLCEHDSNISLSDGTTVKYYCSERDTQIKHHGFEDLSSWKKVFDTFGVSPQDIDAVGIVLDAFRHPHIKCDESKLYETIDVPLFKLLGFDCPVYRIDHHYAHARSVWTLGVETTKDFIFDGFGDDNITHSIFADEEKLLTHCTRDGYESFGTILATFGIKIGLKGAGLDFAGKIMALKACGKASTLTHPLSFINLSQTWFAVDFQKSSDYQIANHIRTCHEATEELFVRHFEEHSTPDDVIGYSGGVAQNTLINSRIKKIRPNLHIPPHVNDCGLSLGIIEVLRQMHEQPEFDRTGYPFWQSDVAPEPPSTKTIKDTALRLAAGEIVGWYQGHGEVGPRALGNRSILMRPDLKDGKWVLNDKVKHREHFRPFGASVLEDKISDYFDWNEKSPYMLYVMDVLDKESLPAITHYDGTCRPQTVSEDHQYFHELLCEFEKLTGLPMLLNTSLNNGGKPICGSPNEALELLCSTELDTLVVGDSTYLK